MLRGHDLLARVAHVDSRVRTRPEWFESAPLTCAPPVTSLELQAVEAALGRRLPESLRELYREIAGSLRLSWRATDIGRRALGERYGQLELLSPAAVVAERARLVAFREGHDDAEGLVSGLVPIASMGAQWWCLDYGAARDEAAVLFVRHDEDVLSCGGFGDFASFFVDWSAAAFIERYDEASPALLSFFGL